MLATAAVLAPPHRKSVPVLRGILSLRLVWNMAFGVLLLADGPRSLAALLELFSRFAIVDGALALLIAGGYLTVSPQRMLWMSPTIDAITRAVLVGLLLIGPGVSTFPLTALLYVGLIATFACADGVLDVAEGLTLRREFGRRGGALSLMVSGVVLALLGATLFARQPEVRDVAVILALLSLTHAGALVAAMVHVSELRLEPVARVAG